MGRLKGEIRNKAWMSPFIAFNILPEILFSTVRQKELIKGIRNGKEEIILHLSADDGIVCVENP